MISDIKRFWIMKSNPYATGNLYTHPEEGISNWGGLNNNDLMSSDLWGGYLLNLQDEIKGP